MSWAVPKPGGGSFVYVKGASEIILGRAASTIDAQGAITPLTEELKAGIYRDVIQPFADSAMRTIGLAYREMDAVPNEELDGTIMNSDKKTFAFSCETQLVLLGIVGIVDPLRDSVPLAIKKCFTAGIDVRMVTGDNLDTAIAIAKDAGILRPEHLGDDGKPKKFRAMEGDFFRKYVNLYDEKGEAQLQQAKFDEIWPYLRVMARAAPDDKLTLAKGLMASRVFEQPARVKALLAEGVTISPDGQVVAMTGDGTNDAPALRAATVGFAMGIAGTQIAKDAANIILLDDNFASIVVAAKWGRNVYDCIQKFLQFQLTVNCAILVLSLIVIIGSGSKERDHPLPVTQMLWLNLIMDSLAALALASEPPTEGQLQRPPVDRSASIITMQMMWNMLGQALYQIIVVTVIFFNDEIFPDWQEDKIVGGVRVEGPYTYHYTIIFNTFVLMQLFNQYNSRFLKGEWNIFVGVHKNPMFVGISLATFGLQVLMTTFAGKALKIHEYPGLTGNQWLMCLAFGVGPIFWQVLINACTRSMALYHHHFEVRGLSEFLKFGGPKHGSARTDMREISKNVSKRVL